MKILAIIPARGGSKGIPRKNMIPLCGKPLIQWTIEQALDSAKIDQLIVATDDFDIGTTAQSLGAEWFRRSDETATDDATTELCLKEVIDDVSQPPTRPPDIVVLLQPTSPIRQPGLIDAAICNFERSNLDSMFSARKVEGYTWSVSRTDVTPNYSSRRRRQEQVMSRIEENGSIYIFRKEVLSMYNSRLGGRIGHFDMHPLDSFQIDSTGDVETVSQILPMRLNAPVITATLTAIAKQRVSVPIQDRNHSSALNAKTGTTVPQDRNHR